MPSRKVVTLIVWDWKEVNKVVNTFSSRYYRCRSNPSSAHMTVGKLLHLSVLGVHLYKMETLLREGTWKALSAVPRVRSVHQELLCGLEFTKYSRKPKATSLQDEKMGLWAQLNSLAVEGAAGML